MSTPLPSQNVAPLRRRQTEQSEAPVLFQIPDLTEPQTPPPNHPALEAAAPAPAPAAEKSDRDAPTRTSTSDKPVASEVRSEQSTGQAPAQQASMPERQERPSPPLATSETIVRQPVVEPPAAEAPLPAAPRQEMSSPTPPASDGEPRAAKPQSNASGYAAPGDKASQRPSPRTGGAAAPSRSGSRRPGNRRRPAPAAGNAWRALTSQILLGGMLVVLFVIAYAVIVGFGSSSEPLDDDLDWNATEVAEEKATPTPTSVAADETGEATSPAQGALYQNPAMDRSPADLAQEQASAPSLDEADDTKPAHEDSSASLAPPLLSGNQGDEASGENDDRFNGSLDLNPPRTSRPQSSQDEPYADSEEDDDTSDDRFSTRPHSETEPRGVAEAKLSGPLGLYGTPTSSAYRYPETDTTKYPAPVESTPAYGANPHTARTEPSSSYSTRGRSNDERTQPGIYQGLR